MLSMLFYLVLGLVGFAVIIVLIHLLFELLVRLSLALMLSIAAGLFGGMVADGLDHDGSITGLLFGLLVFFPTLAIVWRSRGPLGGEVASTTVRPSECLGGKPATFKQDPVPVEEQLGIPDAMAIAKAWDDAERLAAGVDLRDSRHSCAQFLASYEANPDRSISAIDLAVFIRSNVPSLVSDTIELCKVTTSEEQAADIAVMIGHLQEVGIDAERLLKEFNISLRDRLTMRHILFRQRRDIWRTH